jgi:hypothetical protein
VERSRPHAFGAHIGHDLPEPPGLFLCERVREVLGLWHWGNTAFTFAWNGREVLVTQLALGAEIHPFTLRPDGRLVGTGGYHHGETLEVVRGPTGGVDHLVCATFVYTREPYGLTGPATP